MSIKEHDKLGDRLGLILSKLFDGEHLRTEELAEEFGVSIRTIQNDWQRLKYFPIDKKGSAYSLPAYALGQFDSKDIKTFGILSGIGELYPSLDKQIIIDILNTKVNQVLSVRGYKYENLKSKQLLFDQIGSAIVQHRVITFMYKEKHRVIAPYKLINTNGIWYLAGTESTVLKKFAFGKISGFNMTVDSFTQDVEVKERVEDKKSTWFSDNEIEVQLNVDASVAEFFLRRELLPHQNVLENSKERLLLSTKIAYDEELFRIVSYWIPHITIVSPVSLQEKFEMELQSYLNK